MEGAWLPDVQIVPKLAGGGQRLTGRRILR